jgi:hypothetical protein
MRELEREFGIDHCGDHLYDEMLAHPEEAESAPDAALAAGCGRTYIALTRVWSGAGVAAHTAI